MPDIEGLSERACPELSEREREILRLVATGASNKEIAQQLVISTNTVKVHLRNIFAKIGVSSRTEATLYAIRAELVRLPGAPVVKKEEEAVQDRLESAAASTESVAPQAIPIAQPIRQPVVKSLQRYGWLAIPLVMLLIAMPFVLLRPESSPPVSASPASPAAQRWQMKSPLPAERSNFGIATFENKIFIIGGESRQGVTPETLVYDPLSNGWTVLAPKPTAAADASAVVIGGRIYVPGGRKASGEMANVLEVYDPRQNQWEERAALPSAFSAYALASFEGRLYLFGGWDGTRYLDAVYEYDPGQDEWRALSPLSAPRAHAAAVIAAGKLYVIGGYDGTRALATNEEYRPELDNGRDNPWARHEPLPAGRYAMGVTSVADIVHVMGGKGESNELPPLRFFPQQNKWQSFETPASALGAYLGLATVETNIYAIGGRVENHLTAQNLAYKAIYTVLIPLSR